MTEFAVDVEDIENDIVKVSVAGFLDAHTFEQLEQQIESLFNRDVYRIIVDLDRVEYISSAGCGVFIGAIDPVKENGGDIILLNTQPNVMEVFELLGLNQVFRFASDLDEAIAIFEA